MRRGISGGQKKRVTTGIFLKRFFTFVVDIEEFQKYFTVAADIEEFQMN